MDHCSFDPDTVLVRDRFRLLQQARRLRQSGEQGKALHDWQALLERSQAQYRERESQRPAIRYPEGLPITDRLEAIREALTRHQVVIVAGETGSGKTTQLPKLCLELGRGIAGRIGHTQPRRLAARAVATRLAEELGCELGGVVGMQIRFSDQTAPNTLIKVMTDGILLAETQRDPFLNAYDTLIIDEAHERSLNIDFLLGFLHRLLPKRPDLKLIITSATIDVERFSAHFNGAPIVEVSGRTYPVDVRYRPLYRPEEEDSDLSIQDGVLQTLQEIDTEERRQQRLPGDVLVFLVGEREIREMAQVLRKAALPNTDIVPLYARLPTGEQAKIFQPHAGRRVILATNVAETSLTVPGIRYVIDSGEVRMSRYSYRSKVQRLPVEPVSQASANQRMGRCGRVAEGICYRLYSEEDFNARAAFTDPEILRTNLAAVILQMLMLKLGDIEQFPFMQRPETGFINDGYKLLQELGAVDGEKRLTPVGRQLARFPIDPGLARMLIAGAERQALQEVLVVVSALSVQDPRERPHDRQQAAEERHAQWADEQSDFMALLNLWNGFEEQRQALGASRLRDWCRKQFLSFQRLREWRDTHRQLLLISQELKLPLNTAPATYEGLHVALLTGLPTQIGCKDEKNEYVGPRQRRFVIAQGTRVRKTAPAWVMAAELVETQRLFARYVARIDPVWVEKVAGALLKSVYLEPHWSKKRGEVCAYEQKTLYGLIVVPKRRISYARVDPVLARELFIREALVEGEIETRADFVAHNQALRESVERLEDKMRRRDLVVSEDQLFDFYDQRLPAEVHNVRALEHWVKHLDEAARLSLRLTREALLADQSILAVETAYPEEFACEEQRFPLHYAFVPGQQADGVSVTVPLAALPQLPLDRLDWMVPGLLQDKIEALLRTLPKALRKQVVPIPEHARRLAEALRTEAGQGRLTEQLSERLRKFNGLVIRSEDWHPESLPAHLRMNLQVVDEQGRVIDQDRDYHALHQRLQPRLESVLEEGPRVAGFREQKGLRDWPEQPMPEKLEVSEQGMQLALYPYLEDQGQDVALRASFDPSLASDRHPLGVARLVLLRQKPTADFLRRQLPHRQQIGLYFSPVGKVDELLDDFLLATVLKVFLSGKAAPRNRQDFTAMLDRHRGDWVGESERMATTLRDLLAQYHQLARQLDRSWPAALAPSLADVRRQLDHLVFPGFLKQVPWIWILHYPRYFQALSIRLEKMPRQVSVETQFLASMDRHWQRYVERHQKHQREGVQDPELAQYRWLMEEYRVSVFAQQLGTVQSISDKKLDRQFERVSP